MRWLVVPLAAAAAVLWPALALAQTPPAEFADFQALRAATPSTATPHVIVDARDSHSGTIKGDGGGGEFFQNGTVASGGCAAPVGGVGGDDDDGVVIVGTNSSDSNKICWYRQFWGPVHLAWYGAPDATGNIPGSTTIKCYADDTSTGFQACAADAVPRTDTGLAQNAVQKAFDAVNPALTTRAKLPGADGGVVTDGRSIVMYTNDVNISPQQYLSCSGPPGAQRPQITQNAGQAVQYYKLTNSIVLGYNATLLRNPMVLRAAHTRFSSCILRPTWYNAYQLGLVTNTQTLIDDIEHKFYGTATKCGDVDSTGKPTTDGEACDMDDVLAIGFDTCDDTANAPRAHLTNLKFECNVGEAVHANGGGLDLHDANVHNFIEAIMNDSGGGDISRHEWAITGIADDTSNHDEVPITITASGAAPLWGDNPILIGGFTPKTLSPPNSSAYIGNNGPPAFNGLWNVDGTAFPCTGTCTFDLRGSSWKGPGYTANWNAGSNVLSVTDTANIGGGQFLCHLASDTPPFCTPPTGFGPPGSTTFALGQTLAFGATPNSLLINTTPTSRNITSWPQSGLMCMSASCPSGSEYVAYKLVDSGHIQITARGVDGTTQPASTYAINTGVVPSAPMVIAPVPSVNKVIVSATASSAGPQSAYFLNDHTGTYLGTDCVTPNVSACVILNANYRTWTWNTAAGPTPSGVMTAIVQSHGSSSLTLSTGNTLKLQEGMAVTDITHPGRIGTGTIVGATPDELHSADVTISTTPGSVDGDTVVFSGCGYPGYVTRSNISPWLGNCTATAYLLYGTSANNGASGIACDSLHSHGWRVYFHTNNGQETVCSKLIFDSGAGGVIDDNDTADPTSVGIWTEGDADKIEFSQGKSEARTPFLNTGDPANDNVTVSNFNFRTNNDYSLSFANTATTVLSDIHGGASSAGYADSAQKALSLTGNNLANTSLYFDDPTAFRKTTNCANNIFASSPCGDLLGRAVLGGTAPALGGTLAGLGTVSGNDMTGRIALGPITATSTLILNFAASWPSPPVCFAQVETSGTQNLGTASSVSTTLVTFKFATNLSNNQVVSYQCLGFR